MQREEILCDDEEFFRAQTRVWVDMQTEHRNCDILLVSKYWKESVLPHNPQAKRSEFYIYDRDSLIYGEVEGTDIRT